MEIEHPKISNEVIFDICDLEGRIHYSGELNQDQENTNVDLRNFAKGKYQLYIIDEGNILKKVLTFKP